MNLFRTAAKTSIGAFRPNSLLASSLARAYPSPAPSSFLLARFLSDTLRSRLDDTIKKNDIVLFMKGTPDQPMCGFSRAAIQLFDTHSVDFSKLKTFNVLEDEELRQGIKEYSSWPTIPQIYIKGEFIGGIDIMLNMHQSGDLEELLLKEGLLEEPNSEPVEDGKV